MNNRAILLWLTLLCTSLTLAAQSRLDGMRHFELTSGARFQAAIEKVNQDTIYLLLEDGQRIKFLTDQVAHGILDVPSQGVWRPEIDQRDPWSIRLLIGGNASKAEYSREDIRGGGQISLSALKRFNNRILAGPMVGFLVLRPGFSENLVPVGASLTYKVFDRISLTSDLGYAFATSYDERITEAEGGFHAYPRITVKGSHPYNNFNIEFGFGYLIQRAKYTRFNAGRFIGDAIISPGVPGRVFLNIPYRRFCLSATMTFG